MVADGFSNPHAPRATRRTEPSAQETNLQRELDRRKAIARRQAGKVGRELGERGGDIAAQAGGAAAGGLLGGGAGAVVGGIRAGIAAAPTGPGIIPAIVAGAGEGAAEYGTRGAQTGRRLARPIGRWLGRQAGERIAERAAETAARAQSAPLERKLRTLQRQRLESLTDEGESPTIEERFAERLSQAGRWAARQGGESLLGPFLLFGFMILAIGMLFFLAGVVTFHQYFPIS